MGVKLGDLQQHLHKAAQVSRLLDDDARDAAQRGATVRVSMPARATVCLDNNEVNEHSWHGLGKYHGLAAGGVYDG